MSDDLTQDTSPDGEISNYIYAHYTPEYGADLQASITLLYALEVEGVQDTLCEMINGDTQDDELLRVNFSNFIQQQIAAMLSLHGVDLQDARLVESNAVLAALLLVQDTEDPVPYLRLLELNTLGNEEKLAKIIRDFCCLDEVKLISILALVSNDLIALLYKRLIDLEQRSSAMANPNEAHAAIIKNFRLFETVFGKDHFAHLIVHSGMQIGLPMALYLNYVDDIEISGDLDKLAKDIFSLLLLGEDTYAAPVDAFRALSDTLLHDPSQAQKVETAIQKLNEHFEQRKLNHDAA